jgi:predicted DsbA family dithiol-disulfide isomerase
MGAKPKGRVRFGGVPRARRGEILIYSDIGCPWASLAIHRLHLARERVGLIDQVSLDHRAFPLELINERPTPRLTLEKEVRAIEEIEPDLGWTYWDEEEYRHPVTTLPALEAVQAAKQQGLRAGEELDQELRGAFFGRSRCISMQHEVMAAARGCPSVDVDELEAALVAGSARRLVYEQLREAKGPDVEGSPHLFLSDGSDHHNPGIELRWEGEGPGAVPVIEKDYPVAFDEIVERAAAG